MFNKNLKKEAIEKLEKTVEIYDSNVKTVQEKAEELFDLRQKSGVGVIQPVEDYIIQLANSPKEFDKSFSAYKVEFKEFNNLIEEFNADTVNTDFKAGGTAAAGVAAGVGTAALMPSLAMVIATTFVAAGVGTAALMPSLAMGFAKTFGTASTGTAIASLRGAAANNAALAWLGGGALTEGGAGMAGGAAFLALGRPIGAGIVVVGLIGGGLFASSKNKEITQKTNSKRKEIETANAILNASKLEISEISTLTKKHQNGVQRLLEELEKSTPKDYSAFNEEAKQKLGVLINHINSLSALLNKKVA